MYISGQTAPGAAAFGGTAGRLNISDPAPLRDLQPGDTIRARVESESDGTLTMRTPDGTRFTARSEGRQIPVGQTLELTVKSMSTEGATVEISALREVDAAAALRSFGEDPTGANIALLREMSAQKMPLTARGFASARQLMASGREMSAEQAVFMANNRIPANTQTIQRLGALLERRNLIGERLAELLGLLEGEMPQAQPEGASVRTEPGKTGAVLQGESPGTALPEAEAPAGAVDAASSSAKDGEVLQTATSGQGGDPSPVKTVEHGSSVPPRANASEALPQSGRRADSAEVSSAEHDAVQPPSGGAVGSRQAAAKNAQPQSAAPDKAPSAGAGAGRLTGNGIADNAQPAHGRQNGAETVRTDSASGSLPGSLSDRPRGSLSASPARIPGGESARDIRTGAPTETVPSALPRAAKGGAIRVGNAAGGSEPVLVAEAAYTLEEADKPSTEVKSPPRIENAPTGAPLPAEAHETRLRDLPELVKGLYRRVESGREEILSGELDSGAVKRDFEELAKEVLRLSEELPPDTEKAASRVLREIDRSLRFIEEMNRFSSYIQIPVQINGERSTAELYVFNDSEGKKHIDPENASMFLSLGTANIGLVEAFVKVIGKDVECDFGLESRELSASLSGHMQALSELLEAVGYRLAYSSASVYDEPADVAEIARRRPAQSGRYRLDRLV